MPSPHPAGAGSDARLVAAARAGEPDAFGAPLRHVVRPRPRPRVPHPVGRRGRRRRRAGRILVGVAQPRHARGSATRSAAGCSASRATARSIASARTQRARPVDDERLAMIERAQTRPEDRLGAIDDPAHVAEDASKSPRCCGMRPTRSASATAKCWTSTLRHGLTPNEIAEVVGTQPQRGEPARAPRATTTSVRPWARASLWRDGAPSCSALRAELDGRRGVNAFDADAVRVTDRHTKTCAECDERRRTRLSPAAMFAALPIISFPALKAKAAFALDAEGVPMQGSSALAGEPRTWDDTAQRPRHVASRSRSSRPRQSSSASSPSARHASTTAHRSR